MSSAISTDSFHQRSSSSVHDGPELDSREGRRAALVELACKEYHASFDSRGCWVSPLTPPDVRETVWAVFSLLQGREEDVRLANAILRELRFSHHHPTRSALEQNSQFDIFITNHIVQMLVHYGAKLEPDVREKLEGWGRLALRDYAGDRQCDYQFHGMNDNMPSKATLGMILGGEYFEDHEAVEHGLWNLRQLRDLLTRRGLLSEYTSPCYTPLSLVNMTEISQLARNEEARELAAQCAERIWADALGHFHLPTGTMGGPYARAYQLDSTAHFSTMTCLLWIALGHRTAINILDELIRPTIRLVHHHDSRASQLGIVSWVAACRLEPPAYLLEWLESRQFPFQLHASAERGFEGSGEVNTSFYAEEDFALGTADDESWSEGQAETFFLQYRRHRPLRGIEDLRTGYCRYLINSQRPGDHRTDHLLKSHGIVHTVHKKRMALVLSRPSLELSTEDIQRLKFSVIFPEHFGSLEKVVVEANHVFIQDGPVYIGLRGLNVTDWGRGQAIRVESVPNYRLISFYNYEGAAKHFEKEALGRTLNGFICMVGLESEETWDAFRERVKAVEVLDYYHFGSRIVRCKAGKTILGISYAVQTDRVRFRTIDGPCAPRPVWAADGMPMEQLPFMADPRPNTLELPFKHLRAVWAPDQDDKWCIASKGHPRTPNQSIK